MLLPISLPLPFRTSRRACRLAVAALAVVPMVAGAAVAQDLAVGQPGFVCTGTERPAEVRDGGIDLSHRLLDRLPDRTPVLVVDGGWGEGVQVAYFRPDGSLGEGHLPAGQIAATCPEAGPTQVAAAPAAPPKSTPTPAAPAAAAPAPTVAAAPAAPATVPAAAPATAAPAPAAARAQQVLAAFSLPGRFCESLFAELTFLSSFATVADEDLLLLDDCFEREYRADLLALMGLVERLDGTIEVDGGMIQWSLPAGCACVDAVDRLFDEAERRADERDADLDFLMFW